MLTVLIRYTKTKREVLLPAKNVEFIPKGGPDEPGLLVNHAVPADGGCHLPVSEDEGDGRDVFVMNDQGKTIARYYL